MKDRLLTIAISVVLFISGYFTGIWGRCTKPVPAPPVDLLGELSGIARYSPGLRNLLRSSEGREALAAELERIKPEYDAFHDKVDAIEEDFQKELKLLLREPQLQRLTTLKKWAKTPLPADSPPTSAAQTSATQPGAAPAQASTPAPSAVTPPPTPAATANKKPAFQPLDAIASLVIIRNTFNHLNEALQLDPQQQSDVLDLLVKRRAAFLDLVDKEPPPSLKLSQLAPVVKQLTTKPPAKSDR